MIPGLFQSSTIPALEQVVNFAQNRHTLLAGNIANANTPHYRVQDLSVETFQQRLKQAMETRHQPTSPGVRIDTQDDRMREVRESMTSILYHDDSNVGLEQQIAEISKNQSMHNMALTFMRGQFQLLEMAINERL